MNCSHHTGILNVHLLYGANAQEISEVFYFKESKEDIQKILDCHQVLIKNWNETCQRPNTVFSRMTGRDQYKNVTP